MSIAIGQKNHEVILSADRPPNPKTLMKLTCDADPVLESGRTGVPVSVRPDSRLVFDNSCELTSQCKSQAQRLRLREHPISSENSGTCPVGDGLVSEVHGLERTEKRSELMV